MQKFLLLGCLACFVCFSLFLIGYKKLLDGFSPKHIASELSGLTVNGPTDPSRSDIQTLLNQKFYYSSRGSQFFSFESEDKEYILKFVRFSRYRTRLQNFILKFPIPSFQKKIHKTALLEKKRKLEALLISSSLAYNELRTESGLVFMHMSKTDDLQIKTVFFDRLRRPHLLNLDEYEFLIQHRAQLPYTYFGRLIENGSKESAKNSLENLAELLKSRLRKGIFDSDAMIHKNTGIRLGKAMFLDIGQFKIDWRFQNPELAQSEILNLTHHFRIWLKEKDRDLAEYFEANLKIL